ncbi:hypothetical protein D9M68_900250 [compost metagenome]
MGPGHHGGSHADKGQQGIAGIELPDGAGHQADGEVAEGQGNQRGDSHRTQAMAADQPATDLHGDDGKAEEKGDGGLDLLAGPAECLLHG